MLSFWPSEYIQNGINIITYDLNFRMIQCRSGVQVYKTNRYVTDKMMVRGSMLKSNQEDLQKRGYATRTEINALKRLSPAELICLLHSNCAVSRTAAAYNLTYVFAEELLKQLSQETCLYPKIAICAALEKGNESTAKSMCDYLGRIGNNQHKTIPEQVSAKKSYPLPRDIIARTLGKMNPMVLPVLIDMLKCDDLSKTSEVLDAIGFMIFYHPELVSRESLKTIVETANHNRGNDLIVWKHIICLSAFPISESITILRNYASRNDILGEEARRSIRMIHLHRQIESEDFQL